ncbi:pentapeptide repeat-containing protein [Nocardia yunnanensis]|uniref:pentapeptide repeat-containing protein n=1 Tax=Nocardia yunnanensis TaxID=2382165 RepID=UPI0013C4C88B|nr:pentapeptide repeat-containing protein [Nocardia yunnanensis]
MSVLVTAAVMVCLLYLFPMWLTRDSKQEEALRNHLTTAVGAAIPVALSFVGVAKFLLDRAKHRADKFHTAMDRLFNDNADTRADAVRALEQMMSYSPDYRARTLEAFADLLRTRTAALTGNGKRQQLPNDITAILTALRRRRPRRDDPPMNLIGVRLPRAPLHALDLSSAQLADADLRYADLSAANLTGANLDHAMLTGANLTGASLRGTRLTHATLVGATLTGCDLIDAALEHATMTGADLRGLNPGMTAVLTAAQIASATNNPNPEAAEEP